MNVFDCKHEPNCFNVESCSRIVFFDMAKLLTLEQLKSVDGAFQFYTNILMSISSDSEKIQEVIGEFDRLLLSIYFFETRKCNNQDYFYINDKPILEPNNVYNIELFPDVLYKYIK